jgi:hypothetical protein
VLLLTASLHSVACSTQRFGAYAVLLLLLLMCCTAAGLLLQVCLPAMTRQRSGLRQQGLRRAAARLCWVAPPLQVRALYAWCRHKDGCLRGWSVGRLVCWEHSATGVGVGRQDGRTSRDVTSPSQ